MNRKVCNKFNSGRGCFKALSCPFVHSSRPEKRGVWRVIEVSHEEQQVTRPITVAENTVASRQPVVPVTKFDWTDEKEALCRRNGLEKINSRRFGSIELYSCWLKSTDAEFSSGPIWKQFCGPDDGIRLKLHVPTVYQLQGPHGGTNPCWISSVGVLERVPVEFSELICNEFSRLFREASRTDRPIYNALGNLDLELHEICKKLPFRLVVTWSSTEQSKLDEALKIFSGFQDIPLKWQKISEYVGTGKTPRQCWDRLGYMRDQAVGKVPREEVTGETVHIYSESEEEEVVAAAAESTRKQQQPAEDLGTRYIIRFRGLATSGLGVIELDELHVTLVCSRCTRRCLCQYDCTSASTGHRVQQCESCKSLFALSFHGEFVHLGSWKIGELVLNRATISDVIPSNFHGTCIACNATVRLKSLVNGAKRTTACRNCFTKAEISFEAIEVEKIGTAPGVPALLNKPKLRSVKVPRVNLIIGEPLPESGTCSHYKKSWRWFRFPCCGQVFPCNECHDEVTDHPSEWATRIICGFCSREQSSGNKSCICGSVLQGGRSCHWEGGKGCRDPSRMSKKDNKKYKLMRASAKKQTAATQR